MLEKLFTSKNRIKIIAFFFFEKKESYIREVSNILKIPVSAVKREVDNLFAIGILKMDGRKIMLNENCKIIGDLKNIFIKTDYIVNPIKESIKNEKLVFAIIFGSYASGNYKNESDVDLLLIGDVKQSEVFLKIKNAEKKIEKSINPIVWKIEDLKKNKDKAFVKDILNKKKIMMIGDENEFRNIIK
jgi:uncharacterized protein